MPAMRRRGRPGLIGTAARTAVITGTAGAVAGRQQQRAMQRAAAAQPAAPEPEAQAQAPVPAAGAADDIVAQIERLDQLRASGALTEEEFTAAKARLLG